MKRKAFTSDLKAKVAIAALKGHQTTNEIAQEFGVHPIQIRLWPSSCSTMAARPRKLFRKSTGSRYRKIRGISFDGRK